MSFFDDPQCGWALPARLPPPTGPEAWSPLGDFAWTGSKFPGGLAATAATWSEDKDAVRRHNAKFFRENLYFRGIVRRLVTNEINQGLTPDVNPDEDVLGVEEGSLERWVELTEARFNLWAGSAKLCDLARERTFGEIQELVRIEAILDGDCLVRIHTDAATNLPRVEVIPGSRVVNPLNYKVPTGLKLTDGVETDASGAHVAYHVSTLTGVERVPASGSYGRRIAWLVYGTERRASDTRGECLLGLVLQSLKEVDRYRDAAQRKAAINALVAMVVKKTQAVPSTLPIQGGAVSRGTVQTTGTDGSTRAFKTADLLPGMIIEEMNAGEELDMIGGEGTDVNFGAFESVIINAVAWGCEIPPEILTLSFEKNYSASQAAINEFKNYIRKRWKRAGDTLCTPIYIDWLIGEALTGKHVTPGLVEALIDPSRYDTFAALTGVDWYGSVKPATDFLKAARGSQVAVSEGWSTNSIEARGLTGTSFRLNTRKLRRENQRKVQAWQPLAEFLQQYPNMPQIQAAILEGPPDDFVGDSGISG